MLFISHRGNIEGPNPTEENKPAYVQKALNLGYYVEVDVWFVKNKLFLGHDYPQYKCDLDFLKNKYLVCHAKNAEALEYLIQNDIHCFSHEKDNVVLTSHGWLWTYPGCALTSSSVAVMPEMVNNWNIKDCFAVCSNYKSHSLN